jgi:hypothetical protein
MNTVSRILLNLLFVFFMLSACKKDSGSASRIIENCSIQVNPISKPLNNTVHGLDVWASGKLVSGYQDSISIYDQQLLFDFSFHRGDYDEICALADGSVWTFKPEFVFNSYSSSPLVNAWAAIGFRNDCEQVFQYFDMNNLPLSYHAVNLQTKLRCFDQSGSLRYENVLSGVNQGNMANSVLELNNEIWVATFSQDTIEYQPLYDNNGVFKDTLIPNWRGGAIHLHRLNYSGKILATYEFDSILNRHGESLELMKLFLRANSQNIFVVTNDEILKLDRQSGAKSVVPLPFNTCEYRIADAQATSEGFHFSVFDRSGSYLLHYMDLNNQSLITSQPQVPSYFAGLKNNVVFLVQEDAIFRLQPQATPLWLTSSSGIYLDPHRTVKLVMAVFSVPLLLREIQDREKHL